MTELIVHQAGGDLDLNRPIPLTYVTKAEFNQQLLSSDRITVSVQCTEPITFNIGDYIIFEGRKYTLNLNPAVQKKADNSYSYDLQFEGVQYELIRKVLFNQDAGGFFNTSDFPLTGEIDEFLNLIIVNANRDSDFTWSLGTYPTDTEAKTITFSNTNCLAALQTVCSEENFSVEFELLQDLTAKTIVLNIKSLGQVLPFNFQYGFRNGLYSLSRTNVNDSGIITRLYAYGSSENIPTSYRDFSSRLRMPSDYGDYVQDSGKTAMYGLIEGVMNFDDIKPSFTGIVSAVGSLANGLQEITVSNMDFDLNEKKADGSTKYLIADTPAKISVKKGNLAGYEFELNAYDHATKTFKLKQFADTRGQKFPDANTVFTFAVGDEFTLLDIIMPDSYITAAENKLKDKAVEQYAKLSQANVKYALDIDPMYWVDLGYTENTKILGIGDFVTIVDTKLGINKQSRITSLTRDLLNPFKYSCDISDTYEVGIVASTLETIKTIQTTVKAQTKVNAEMMLNGYRRMLELQGLVFDTDGYFDMGNIRPLSIETSMLTVGAKSQTLTLKDVIFTPNASGNVNNINISAGSLIHFTIDSAGIKTWTLSAANITGLSSSNSYYIYAKVARSGATGTYEVTTTQYKFDQVSNYYYFLLGVLFKPANNVRLIQLTYGSSYINGRVITTGRITSIDGQTWFDLDTGEFHGKFTFSNGTDVQTVVTGAQNTADSAATAAANAQTAANNANTAVSNLNTYVDGAFADGIISEAEAIAIEKYINAVTTEYNAFDNQYNILYNNSYLAGTPKTNLASAKTAYNTAKNNLLLSINTAIADGKTTTAEKSDVDSKYSSYKTALGTLQTRIEEANTSIQSYLNNAAATAQTTANSAISQLTDISSDSKLTPSEKQTTQNEWNRIKTEYAQNYSVATNLGVSTTAYTSAYNTLNTYITPLLSNLATTSDIVGATFRTNFQNYYTQNVAILTAIENAKIDNVQVGGRNLVRNGAAKNGVSLWSVGGNNIISGSLLVYSHNFYKNGSEPMFLIKTTSTSEFYINSTRFNVKPNTTYTIAFYAFMNNNCKNYDLYFMSRASGSTNLHDTINQLVNNKKLSTSKADYKMFTFTTGANDASAYIRFDNNGSNTEGSESWLLISGIMVVEGTKALSDWTPAPEDVDAAIATNAAAAANALAQAQNAQNTASGAAAITNGLFTTINGNIVATGTMLVGSATSMNGGMTGVIDNSQDSVSLWFGTTYANRYTAPFRVTQAGYAYMSGMMIESKKPGSNAGITMKDGLITITRSDSSTAFKIGVVDDKETFNIYNSSGVLVAAIDDRGITFTGYIPESYDEWKLRKLTGSTDAARQTEYLSNIAKSLVSGNDYDFFLVSNATGYEYQAGRNFESSANAEYQGKIFSAQNKLGSFIADGFYALYFKTTITVNTATQLITLYGTIWQIVSGIIVDSKAVTMTKRADLFITN